MSIHGHHSFWATTPALLIVAFACALLFALALLALLSPRLRRDGLRTRVGEFTSATAPLASRSLAVLEISRARHWADKLFGRRAWWSAFKEKLEVAHIRRSPAEIVLATVVVAAGVAVAVWALTGVLVLALVLLGTVPSGTLVLVNGRVRRERRTFGEQLASHLQEVAAAMRAGHSLVGGLRTVAASAAEPMRTELERVLADEQLGVPLKDALQPMARRMASDDVKQVALVASLHEGTGGNMATVLDHVAEGVRERVELRRELQSLTAQARMSRWIVTLLPPGLLLIISLEDSSYVRPLFETSSGVLLLLVGAGMVIVGSLVMKAIVDVEA